MAKQLPDQVRSGHQRVFVDPTSEKIAITPEIVFHGTSSSLQVSIMVPVCAICIFHNVYICDLRSGQLRDLYIVSLWDNIEMRPSSSERVKTTQLFQDYDRLSHVQ